MCIQRGALALLKPSFDPLSALIMPRQNLTAQLLPMYNVIRGSSRHRTSMTSLRFTFSTVYVHDCCHRANAALCVNRRAPCWPVVIIIIIKLPFNFYYALIK